MQQFNQSKRTCRLMRKAAYNVVTNFACLVYMGMLQHVLLHCLPRARRACAR